MTLDKDKIIRAWKDPAYRASLSAEERRWLDELAKHPAGESGDISDVLDQVAGGYKDTSSDGSSCGMICTFTCECLCPTSGWPTGNPGS